MLVHSRSRPIHSCEAVVRTTCGRGGPPGVLRLDRVFGVFVGVVAHLGEDG